MSANIKLFIIIVLEVMLFSCIFSLISVNKKDVKYINLLLIIYIIFSLGFGNISDFNCTYEEYKLYYDEIISKAGTIAECTQKYIETGQKNE